MLKKVMDYNGDVQYIEADGEDAKRINDLLIAQKNGEIFRIKKGGDCDVM